MKYQVNYVPRNQITQLQSLLFALTSLALITMANTGSLSLWSHPRTHSLVRAEKLYFVASPGSQNETSSLDSHIKNSEEANGLLAGDNLVDCVKYHFHKRKYYIKQKKHDSLAIRLQLDLIAKQLCFSDISLLPSLENFADLKLTASEDSLEGYVSKFAFNESHYFSPEVTDVQCQVNSKIYFTQKGKSTGSGMGSRMHMLVSHLHLILAYNNPSRILALEPGGWEYTNSSVCEYSDLRCYFQEITQCVLKEKSLRSSERALLNSNLMPRWNDPNSLVTRNLNTVLPMRNGVRGTREFVREIPEIYASRGWLWYYSQIFYFMFQPNDYLQHEFSDLKLEFNDHIQNKNSIFMHIRHGDKFIEADMFDGNSYLTSATLLEKRKPDAKETYKSSIFVSTDDEHIFSNLKETHSDIFDFNHIPKRVYTTGAYEALRSSKVDGAEEAVTIFKQMFVAISSECFIGSFSSGLSRAMFKLMIAVQGEIPDHFSLSPWSHDVNGEGPRLSKVWLWS